MGKHLITQGNKAMGIDQLISDRPEESIEFGMDSIKSINSVQIKSANLHSDELFDPRADMVPAYVASLIKCKQGSSVTGFLDAAIILRHSIHKNSIHNPKGSGKYSYKMYAIVHEDCKEFAPVLRKVGYETIIRDTPIDRRKIKGEAYRQSVENAMCCGSAEFIKMYAYTLEKHPAVAHFDLDKIILKPMDDLFDAMIFTNDSEIGKRARSKLDLEWKEDQTNLPERIDAFFTRDYTSSWPWKKIAGVQGGFLVLRPSQNAFDQYMNIILEGNYTMGFNNECGWGGLGFGGWVGGMVSYINIRSRESLSSLLTHLFVFVHQSY